MMASQYKSPLHEMACTTPTNYWNDSCSVEELTYAIERGAVGATSNPQIVLEVLKKEMHLWNDFIHKTIRDNPTWSEIEVAWKVYEALAVNGSKLLLPIFEQSKGKRGRLSIQTNPALYRNSKAILEQTLHFHSLVPNFNIKVPATKAGLEMVEEATYQGANVNVTVSFTVPQVIAVAEAVERGLRRREKEGKDVDSMSPIATMMIGRTDDWMKVLVGLDHIDIDPEYLEWAGVACFKKAYGIFKQRGYRARLLAAAYRNFYHWTEFIGGDCSLTMPWKWQVKFNESDVKVEERMSVPVKEEIVKALYDKIPDFRKAYDENGMSIAEFDTYGATVRTLRTFIAAWHDFVAVIRDFMLPNPDVRA
ncbi:MAG: transaldolase [Anaerolineae bacterium]|nr:transaldolase [Anaerolineae bacterium]